MKSRVSVLLACSSPEAASRFERAQTRSCRLRRPGRPRRAWRQWRPQSPAAAHTTRHASCARPDFRRAPVEKCRRRRARSPTRVAHTVVLPSIVASIARPSKCRPAGPLVGAATAPGVLRAYLLWCSACVVARVGRVRNVGAATGRCPRRRSSSANTSAQSRNFNSKNSPSRPSTSATASCASSKREPARGVLLRAHLREHCARNRARARSAPRPWPPLSPCVRSAAP